MRGDGLFTGEQREAIVREVQDVGNIPGEEIEMISYRFGLLKILAHGFIAPGIQFDQELRLRFRCGFFDCDGLRVMTASRYAVCMDFARWSFVTRTGFTAYAFKKGWAPALGSQKIIYRKPVKLGESFDVRVSYAGSDNKWIYNLHILKKAGEIRAIGITKGVTWHKGKMIPMEQVLTEIGAQKYIREVPDWIGDLFSDDSKILKMDFSQTK